MNFSSKCVVDNRPLYRVKIDLAGIVIPARGRADHALTYQTVYARLTQNDFYDVTTSA